MDYLINCRELHTPEATFVTAQHGQAAAVFGIPYLTKENTTKQKASVDLQVLPIPEQITINRRINRLICFKKRILFANFCENLT